ncbi:hypothetical protein [Vibrio splendidus]|uniref:Uncharacterized protein n=1 Tax=Vibrio splendidus TaxID=29497 RepID=A0ABD5A4Y0_VIBSP|nr:hypothetical protein [Vibrio splendidus]MDP2488239.1 hypothetical protein [Vibrio splendidus]PMI76533.1 hypothetical protein BCU38_06130 [Vibrio splendidus]PMO58043.1 hypothetical protein BCT08_00790 [Vibrio splendidus]
MKKINLLASLLMLSFAGTSQGALIKTADLNKYCNYEKSQRQTIVYLDQNSIGKNDRDWFRDIINKLDYLPSEKLSIVQINDASRVEELFSSCYPKISDATYKKLLENKGFLDADPKKVLADDQKLFKGRIFGAFSKVMESSEHATKPNFDSQSLPKKSIVEALYYDASRTELVNGLSRVIIYSDMLENSTTYSSNKKPIPAAVATAERFPVSYSNASIYAYGVGTTTKGTDGRSLEVFWKNYFNLAGANLVSFQQQLPPKSNAIRSDVRSYKGVMDLDGRNIALSLRLSKKQGQSSGTLTSSFFAIKDDLYPLKGTFSCKNNQCKISAKLAFTAPIETFSFQKDDVLALTGSFDGKLKGIIGSEDDTTTTETGDKFQYNVIFDADSTLTF